MGERKPIFDAIRTARGKGFDTADVLAIDRLLDSLGVPDERKIADAEAFFKGVRGVTGPLNMEQVVTIEDLLSAAAHWPVAWLAYGLATAWHEARLEPIEEWGMGKGRPYAQPGKYGQSQHGRGLVQLTWDRNYEWADKECCGGDGSLLKNFGRALEPEIATKILVRGMETGAFTGKKLSDYLPDRANHTQFAAARRIINGTDKADLIANLAEKFQAALLAGGWA